MVYRHSLVDELCADTKGLSHIAQSEGAVGLQQLAVGLDPHLPHIVAVVWREEPVLLHLLLHHGCATKRKFLSHYWCGKVAGQEKIQ